MQELITKPSTFAPVIITTLCRHEHFKQCLESLMKCTWAEETDVYIGLDYPAKESHWDGYKKICAYLDNITYTHSFKSLNIIKRETNYGFGPNGNLATLRKYIFAFSETIIFSEDDNIFSPAFLDYINKGLEIYKDNKDVVAICGYRNYYDFVFEDNTVARQGIDFVAWGYGYWKDRADDIAKITPSWFRQKLSIRKFISFCKSNGNYRALCWLQYAFRPKNNFAMPDDGISVYMGLTGKYTIMPYETLVRNTGTDGSGQHFKKKRPHLTEAILSQKLYDNNVFNIAGDINSHYLKNMKINIDQAYKRISNFRFPYEIGKMIFEKAKTFLKNKTNVF